MVPLPEKKGKRTRPGAERDAAAHQCEPALTHEAYPIHPSLSLAVTSPTTAREQSGVQLVAVPSSAVQDEVYHYSGTAGLCS